MVWQQNKVLISSRHLFWKAPVQITVWLNNKWKENFKKKIDLSILNYLTISWPITIINHVENKRLE